MGLGIIRRQQRILVDVIDCPPVESDIPIGGDVQQFRALDCSAHFRDPVIRDRGRGNGTLCEQQRLIGEDTIMNRLVQWKYSQEQKDELHRMVSMGMPKKDILAIFYPETDVERMQEIRKMFNSLNED